MATGIQVGNIFIDLTFRQKGLATARKQLQSSMKGINKNMKQGAKQTEQSFGTVIREMLRFRNIAAKIIHYITFSIGVQLVMGVRRAIEDMVRIFIEFEKSVTNAAAVSGYLGSSFDKALESINRLTRTLANKTIFTATEVAKAMYTISSAGIDPVISSTEELLPILQYATATQTDLDEATKYVITTLKQFKLGLEDTGVVVDTFTALITNSFMTAEKMANAFQYAGQIAGELNQDLGEVASVLTLLTDRGYTGGQAGQRLNMMFTKLLAPTEKSKKALAELGLTVSDLDPSVHSIVDILHKLKNANFSVATSSQMFRARTAAAAATLVNAVDEIEEYVIISKEMAGITEFIAERQMETLDATFKQLAGSAQELAISLGDTLADALFTLKGAFEYATDAAGGFFGDVFGEDWFGGTIFGDIIGKAGALLDFIKQSLEIKEAAETAGKALKASSELLKAFSHETEWSQGAVQDYANAFDDVMRIQQEMEKYTTSAMKDTEEYKTLLLELTAANIALANSENEVIKTSTAILTNLHDMGKGASEGIKAYTNWYAAGSKVDQLTISHENQQKELVELGEEIKTVGLNTEEYITLMNRYDNVSRQLETTKEDLSVATDKETEAEEEFWKIYNKAGKSQQDYIDIARNVVDIRGQLFRAQREYNEALVEFNRLTDIQENKEKYLAEAMLDVYDLQDKLYKLELDRYKLAEDKKKLDDELFEQLGEQGLLTEDIIEQYKEWKQAEGDLAGARAAYARGDITLEELQGYIDRAAQEQSEYSNLVQETAQHYVDIGIASNDVATTLTQIKDQSNDELQIASEIEIVMIAIADAERTVDELMKDIVTSTEGAKTKMEEYEDEVQKLIDLLALIPEEITTVHTTYHRDYYGGKSPGWDYPGTGGPIRPDVFGQHGFITKGQTMAMIGEAGREAVLPLEGANKKYGRDILDYILPKYYPELMRARGGVFGGGGTNITNRGGDTYSDAYNITGPVNINANNVGDFMNQLKYKSRVSKRN